MASPQSASVHHLHPVGDVCPTCDQPIPHDRAEAVAQRLEARDKQRAAEVASQLEERFARERVEADERARLATEQQVATARAEAVASAQSQIAAAAQARQEAEQALAQQAEVFSSEREAAAAMQTALQQTIEQNDAASKAELEKVREEAAAREVTVKAEATAAAEAKSTDQLAALEAARSAAQVAAQVAEGRLADVQTEHASALEAMEAKATEREAIARHEANEAAKARLVAAEAAHAAAQTAQAAAESKAAEAEAALNSAQAAHAMELESRLTEQRSALENDKAAAVNAEKVASFEANLKLSSRIEELQRMLEKQASDELGEGAEVQLFEALLGEFQGDLITRVGRGNAGADIIHVVMHNGRECGKIIYDSKDHGAWRGEFVTKLKADQMAAQAEHAILSIRKFPAGARQVHHQDGVLIANPARVVALVTMLRNHVIQTHTLRLSGEARAQKTAALYDFITSERARDLFSRFDTHTRDLEDLQVKEKKAHDATWRKQGELYRSIGRVKTEITVQIDAIIGGADPVEEQS